MKTKSIRSGLPKQSATVERTTDSGLAILKWIFTACFLSIVTAGVLVAQGTITSGGRRWAVVQTYDGKTPPPLSLPEAYMRALSRVGEATNRFYCVSASSLEMTNNGFTGWTFWFSNTNSQRARVDVFFDKEVSIGIPSDNLLRGR